MVSIYELDLSNNETVIESIVNHEVSIGFIEQPTDANWLAPAVQKMQSDIQAILKGIVSIEAKLSMGDKKPIEKFPIAEEESEHLCVVSADLIKSWVKNKDVEKLKETALQAGIAPHIVKNLGPAQLGKMIIDNAKKDGLYADGKL